MQRSYGDVVRLRWWPDVYHLVSDPDAVRHVLVDGADQYHAAFDPPLNADGEAHPSRRFHQLVRELLHGDGGVGALVPTMGAVIANWLAGWEGRQREPFDGAGDMAALTLAVLGAALLHADITTQADALARALSVTSTSGALQKRVSALQSLGAPPATSDPLFRRSTQTVDEIVRQLIARRRQDGSGGSDLLSRMIFDRETDHPDRLVSDDQVVAALWVLLIAGHSAPSSALAWSLHVVATRPEVRARLEQEVDSVLGGRVPTAADLPRLRFTRLVLLETMRLYPPVWMLQPRTVSRADVITGYEIPAGTKIAISPWVLHHHPAHWDRPDAFDPERFARHEPRAYLPFGSGPGACVAAQFGLTETRLTLAMLVQRYRWEPVAGSAVADPQVALWPKGGLPILVRSRS